MSPETTAAPGRYIEALNAGMATALEEDERVVLIGIDVGAGGGIFRVTKGLHERFGSERVLDTPISEMGFVGAAVGAAMTGLRPIVEIMFMDFVGVCLDPILNQAAKLRYMTAGALEIPVVFRMQTGAGKSAGAQHSQSLEAWFAHIPGLKVVMPATVADARDLLLASVRDPNPVVFIENRRLYGMKGDVDAEPLPLGKARIARRGEDVTVVTWGQMLHRCLAAAEESEDVSLEVIDLRSLVPLDLETILRSVEKTGKCVVASQAIHIGSYTAEIASTIQDEAFDYLDAPVKRVGAKNGIAPQSHILEAAFLPNVNDIVAAAKSIL